MLIIPAIDIRGGRCVRLRQGDYNAETIFDADPVAAARRWLAAGAARLHVVDLDGARAGEPVHFDLVTAIARLGTPTQVGGGIRTAAAVARYRAAGLDRVVLGTAAVRDRPLVEALCRDHGDAIVVSLDTRDGLVATDGWTATSSMQAADLAAALTGLGVQRLRLHRYRPRRDPDGAELRGLAEVCRRRATAGDRLRRRRSGGAAGAAGAHGSGGGDRWARPL